MYYNCLRPVITPVFAVEPDMFFDIEIIARCLGFY